MGCRRLTSFTAALFLILLHVHGAPVITQAPLSRLATVGQALHAQVEASGSGMLNYQWKRNGLAIPGATQASLDLTSVALTDRGFYEVVVGDASGASTTSVWRLDVGAPASRVIGWGPGSYVPEGLTDVAALAPNSFGSHFLALRTNGRVVAWSGYSSSVVAVPEGLEQVVALAGGQNHSLALRADGTVVQWGLTTLATQIPQNLDRVIAVAAGGNINAALRADGTVVAWGLQWERRFIVHDFLTGIVGIAVTKDAVIGLRGDGRVVVKSYVGEPFDLPPETLSDVVAIAAGDNHCLALCRDGSVVGWGSDYMGNVKIPASVSPALGVAASSLESFVLRSGGTVEVYGINTIDQKRVPNLLNGAIALGYCQAIVPAFGPSTSMKTESRSVVLGDAIELTASVTGTLPFTLQWKRNGVALVDGGRISGATTERLVVDPVDAGDAGDYVLHVTNAFGETASGAVTVQLRTPPRIVQRPLSRLVEVGRPLEVSVPATDAGTIAYQWRRNGRVLAGVTGDTLRIPAAAMTDEGRYEVLLTGSEASSFTVFYVSVTKVPVASRRVVSSDIVMDISIRKMDTTKVVALAANEAFCVALTEEGRVLGFGSGGFGQNAIPEDLDQVVAVALGDYYVVALRADGSVRSWGEYSSMPGNSPFGLRRAVAVAAAGGRAFALTSDGAVVPWGTHKVPDGWDHVIELAVTSTQMTALKSDGSLLSFSTQPPHLNMPANLTGVVAFKSGRDCTVAVTGSGELRGWGEGWQAQSARLQPLVAVKTLVVGAGRTFTLSDDGLLVCHQGDSSYPTQCGVIAAASANGLTTLVGTDFPTLIKQPVAIKCYEGDAVFLPVAFSSRPESTILWTKDGTALEQTSAMLSILSAAPSDAGEYKVSIHGIVITQPFRLEVLPVPSFAGGSAAVKLAEVGTETYIKVLPADTAIASYRWKKNGQSLPGATTDTLTFPQVQFSDAGTYSVELVTAAGLKLFRNHVLKVYAADSTVVAIDMGAFMPRPPSVDHVVEAAGGYGFGLLLRSDGSVIGWGNAAATGSLEVPEDLRNVVGIAAGRAYALALKVDGTVVGWGDNSRGQIDIPKDLSDVVAIAASGNLNIALRADGTVRTWGVGEMGYVTAPDILRRVIAVACQDDGCMVLKADGSAFRWDRYSANHIDVASSLNDAVGVAMNADSNYVVRKDGSVYGWPLGSTIAGLMPKDLGIVRLLASAPRFSMALGMDGRVRFWGNLGSATQLPSSLPRAVQLVGSNGHALAVLAERAAPPSIVSQPTRVTLVPGEDVVLSVVVAGTPPFKYQWSRNGLNSWWANGITGTDTPTLRLPQAVPGDVGEYLLKITNRDGSILSAPISLALRTGTITTSTAPVVGGSVTLTAALEGSTGYQWRLNGSILSGATNATLTLSELSRSNNGLYDVVATTPGGPVVLDAHSLNVAPTSTIDTYQVSSTYAPILEREGGGAIRAQVMLPDGKILIGGEFTHLAGVRIAYLARLNADGSLDAGFVPPKLNGPVHALLLDPAGGVYIGGAFSQVADKHMGGVCRLGVDLTLDTFFDVGVGFAGTVYALGWQPDGRLLVGGAFSSFRTESVSKLVRLLPNGGRDTGFLASPSFEVRILIVEADGSFVAAGGWTASDSSQSYGVIYRCFANGTVDASWTPGLSLDYVTAVARTLEGKWLVGAGSSWKDRLRVVRLLANGQHDASFTLDPELYEACSNVTLLAGLSNGKVLIGSKGSPLCRLNETGSLDRTCLPLSAVGQLAVLPQALPNGDLRCYGLYASAAGAVPALGWVTLPAAANAFLQGPLLPVRGVAELFGIRSGPERTLYVHGDFTHVNDERHAGLVRLTQQGTVDGRFRAAVAPEASELIGPVFQGDGRIVVYSNGAVQRLLPDGALDAAYPVRKMPLEQMVLATDGGVFVAGKDPASAPTASKIIRKWKISGEPDVSFGAAYQGVLNTLVPMAGGRVVLNRGLTQVNGEKVSADFFHRLMADGTSDRRFYMQANAPTRILPETHERIYQLVSGVQLRRNLYDGNQDFFIDGVTSLCLCPDGRLLLGRKSGLATADGSSGYPILSRQSSTGAPDTSLAVLDLDPWRAQIRQIAMEDDGSLVLIGRSLALDGKQRYGLLRLEASVAVKIVTNPASVVGSLGEEAVFSVIATGSGVLGYQWFRNGQAVEGATNATLRLSRLKMEDAGSYTVKVSNRSSTVTSSPATLGGGRPSPVILAQPQSCEVVSGATVTFSVSAQPGAPGGTLSYQWRRQGFPIAGATGAHLVLERVKRFDASFYDVLVSDGLTSIRSDNARLTVDPFAMPNVLTVDSAFKARVETWGGEIAAIHPTADGKFLVTGTFTRIGGLSRPGLARLDAQFAVDPAFVPDQELIDPTVFALVADGKVIVGTRKVGQESSVAGYYLLRLNADGTRDASFQPSADIGNVTCASLQNDGTLVAASGYPLDNRRSLFKIASNGSYDPAFMPLFERNGSETAVPVAVSVVASLPDGTILCYGFYNLLNGNPVSGWVRLRQDGSRVENFNVSLGAGSSTVRQIIQKSDGRLLLFGFDLSQSPTFSRVVCLMPDGSADSAFVPDSDVRDAFKLFPQADGSVMVFTQSGNTTRVGRLTADGRSENRVEFASCPVSTKDAAWTASGELILGGEAVLDPFQPVYDLGKTLWRLRAGSANVAAVTTEKVSGVSCLARGPGGTIYLGGEFTRVNGEPRRHVARLFANGDTDTSFGCADSLNGAVRRLLVQPDGRVIVFGNFTHYGAKAVGSTIRLSPDGAHDVSFVSAMPNGMPLLQVGERKILVSGFGRLFDDGSLDEAVSQNIQAIHTVERIDRSCWVYHQDTTTTAAPCLLGVLAEEGVFQKGYGIGQYGDIRSIIDRHDGSFLLGANANVYVKGRPAGVAPIVEHYMKDRIKDGGYLGMSYPTPESYVNSAAGPYLFDPGDGYTLVSSYLGVYRLDRRGALDTAFDFPKVSKLYTGAVSEIADGIKDILVLDDGRLLMADRGFRIGNRIAQGLVMLGAASTPFIVPLPATAFAPIGKSWSMTATIQGGGDALSFQWYRNGAIIADANNATLALASPTTADSGLYILRVTNALGAAMSTGLQLTVDVERVPPSFLQVPENQWVPAGTDVIFTVRTAGTGPMTYAWEKNGVLLANGGRLSGCDTATLSIASAQLTDGGLFRIKVTNEAGFATSSAARLSVVPAGVAGAHSCPGWSPEGTATVTVVVTHNGAASAMSVSALVPDGWSYVGGSGEPAAKPAVGDGGALVWSFASVPASPVAFSYTLAVPAAQTGVKTVATVVSMTLTEGDASFLLKPDPLILRSLRHHSADTDNDWKIGTAELLRVLDLYATRKDAARTGAYAVGEPSLDGFAPDPLRPPEDNSPLSRHHSADSDRNGRLSLLELTRVIQLHNTRAGGVRTGAYRLRRAEDTAQDDGFVPGP